MAFFQFGRKLEIAKEYSLEEIPVFSALTPSEQKLIQRQARLTEYKRGDIVYQEGTASEFFYVVISGRYRLFRSHGGKREETLHYFYRGDHFGETSLLNNQAHSASVEAKSDGLTLKLTKEDFLKIVKEIPSISLHLSRSLGHRLTRNTDAGGKREVKLCALYSSVQERRVSQFWVDLAGDIVQEAKGKVALIDFLPGKDPVFYEEFGDHDHQFNLNRMDPSSEQDFNRCIFSHPQGFDYISIDSEEPINEDKKISILMTFLTYRYNYVLIRLPSNVSDVSFRTLKKTDHVYVYTSLESSALNECAHAILEFQQSFGFSKSEIKLIMPDDRQAITQSFDQEEHLLGVQIFSLVPSKVEKLDRYQVAVRFLAKELVGTLLGLVLSSGAAYGMAHIGVLKVLEQEGIRPDIIAGTSIGALIGALWAAGYRAEEMEALAQKFNKSSAFFNLIGFGDITLFDQGFLKGNRVRKFLESLLGDRRFEDLKVPLRVIAADLFTSEEMILNHGRVVDAVRASISIPGIFKPVTLDDRYMIDGGVIDPLPVRVLAREGIKKIIAVNVLCGPRDRIARNVARFKGEQNFKDSIEDKNPFRKVWAKGLHKVSNRYAVNIFNIIMSTVQFMEFEIANTWGSQADILIHPVVPEGHWAEFYAPQKYIAMGEQKTREQLNEIKRLLNE